MSGEAPGSRASPHTDESPVNQRPGGRGPRRRLPHDDRGPPGWPGSRLFIWGFGQPPPPPQPPAKVLKSTVSLDQIQLLAFFFFSKISCAPQTSGIRLGRTGQSQAAGQVPCGTSGGDRHSREPSRTAGRGTVQSLQEDSLHAGPGPSRLPQSRWETEARTPRRAPGDCRVVASRTAPGPSLTTVAKRLTAAGLARCTACPTARVGPSAHGEQGRP